MKTSRNVSKISIPTAWPAVTPAAGTVAPSVPRFSFGVMYFNTAEPMIPVIKKRTKMHCSQTSVNSIFILMQRRIFKTKVLTSMLTHLIKNTNANDITQNVFNARISVLNTIFTTKSARIFILSQHWHVRLRNNYVGKHAVRVHLHNCVSVMKCWGLWTIAHLRLFSYSRGE